jgi:predicted RNA-binding Zn-ribbon protein involved in translation (DUF1610 family)
MRRAQVRKIICPNCGREGKFVLQFPWTTEFFCSHCHALSRMTDRFRKLSSNRMITYESSVVFGSISLSFVGLGFIQTETSDAEICILIGAVFLIPTILLISASIAITIMLRNVDVWEAAWSKRRCLRCGTVALPDRDHYCPSCGASLLLDGRLASTQNSRSPKPKLQEGPPGSQHAEKCAVCKTEMKPYDAALQCPRCGSTFHAIHLVEYVHVHGQCPVCGEHLDESDLMQHLREEEK